MIFDENAPISSFINYINLTASTALNGVAGTMIETISQLALACFTIYIILMMWSYMRGAVDDPVQDFLMKFFAWSLIIGYGMNAETYTSTILPIVTGLGDSFLKMFGNSTDASAMDTLFNTVGDLIGGGLYKINETASLTNPQIGSYLTWLLDAALLIAGIFPFLITATVMVIVANLGAQIVASVGPLFFFALLFPSTRQYFSAWLNTVLSYAFIPLFVAVVSMLAVGTTNGILDLKPGETILTVSFAKILFVAFADWVFVFLLMQLSSVASSLSSGGINAGMPSGGHGAMIRAVKGLGGATGRGAKAGISGVNHLRLNARRERANKNNTIRQG